MSVVTRCSIRNAMALPTRDYLCGSKDSPSRIVWLRVTVNTDRAAATKAKDTVTRDSAAAFGLGEVRHGNNGDTMPSSKCLQPANQSPGLQRDIARMNGRTSVEDRQALTGSTITSRGLRTSWRACSERAILVDQTEWSRPKLIDASRARRYARGRGSAPAASRRGRELSLPHYLPR